MTRYKATKQIHSTDEHYFGYPYELRGKEVWVEVPEDNVEAEIIAGRILPNPKVSKPVPSVEKEAKPTSPPPIEKEIKATPTPNAVSSSVSADLTATVVKSETSPQPSVEAKEVKETVNAAG